MKRINHPTRSRAGTASLILAAGLALSQTAAGATLTWSNVSGGSAATANNWSPVQSPTSGDDLTFSLSGSYGVTFGSTTASSHSHVYTRGGLTLTMTALHTASSGITVGNASGDNPTVTVTSGSL